MPRVSSRLSKQEHLVQFHYDRLSRDPVEHGDTAAGVDA